MKIKDGDNFNRWTVLYLSDYRDKKGNPYWLCRCKCGTEKPVRQSHLVKGGSKSCGCLMKDLKTQLTHGQSGTKLHRIWIGIRQRCNDKNSTQYFRYGAIGVKMCDEWNDFTRFRDWCLNNGWKEKMQVCRKGDIGNYSPDNCYIATAKQNYQDRKSNKLNMDIADNIRDMFSKGLTRSQIANKLNIKYDSVKRVVGGTQWVR